ncbi:MAG: hypothetical protein HY300_04720, partial [Verrucomicrobia bacterium]|nr:hypothetical protein [Verrucomicrobiota bacterium]
RIALIGKSMRCFACGWLSLVPVVGVAFGVHALWLFRKARHESSPAWNPADAHLFAGALLAVAGLLLTVGWIGIAAKFFNPGD